MPTATAETAARSTTPVRTADAAAALRTYLQNLAALYTSDAPLAAAIEAIPFEALPALERTRDGLTTARLISDDGRPVYAHSRHRPREEAAALVRGARTTAPGAAPDEPGSPPAGEPDNSADAVCHALSGSGLGYHIAEIEAAASRPIILVLEEDLALLKAALCTTDVAALLRERRLAFLTDRDKSAIHAKLREYGTVMLLGLRWLILPYAPRCRAEFHTQMRAMVRDFVAYTRIQIVSLVRNAQITTRNMALNLPHYLDNPGVERLAGRAAGYPAILIAAGPSLARNIDQLAALRGRAVLIAVQTVLKQLLARGITPHFVASLDYHEICGQFFDGLADVGDCTLVAEPKATWHVFDRYPGRKIVLHREFYDDLLRGASPRRGTLRAGSTVAHLCFYLAEHLARDPILLVGQDLAYCEGFYYPPGMPIERTWGPELGRFQTIEMKQWERIVRARRMLRIVKDIHGRDAYSDEQLYTYAEQFQSDFARSPARVIHASEGGMRLSGTEVMPLRTAAERFCTRDLPPDLFALSQTGRRTALRRGAANALEERQREIGALSRIGAEMQTLLRRLADLVEKPAEFNRLVGRVDELRMRIRELEQSYALVASVAQHAELRRYSADLQIGTQEQETPAVARRRLKRDSEFVAAFLDGCRFLERMLPEALARVRGGGA